jgi:hypothetical protein
MDNPLSPFVPFSGYKPNPFYQPQQNLLGTSHIFYSTADELDELEEIVQYMPEQLLLNDTGLSTLMEFDMPFTFQREGDEIELNTNTPTIKSFRTIFASAYKQYNNLVKWENGKKVISELANQAKKRANLLFGNVCLYLQTHYKCQGVDDNYNKNKEVFYIGDTIKVSNTFWVKQSDWTSLPENGTNGIWYFKYHEQKDYYAIFFYFDINGIKTLLENTVKDLGWQHFVVRQERQTYKLNKTERLLSLEESRIVLGGKYEPHLGAGYRVYSYYGVDKSNIYIPAKLFDLGLLHTKDISQLRILSEDYLDDFKPVMYQKERETLYECASPEVYQQGVKSGYITDCAYNLWLAYGMDFTLLQRIRLVTTVKNGKTHYHILLKERYFTEEMQRSLYFLCFII